MKGLIIEQGKHPSSLKLQRVPIEEFSQTFDYGLKDITKLDDLKQVVDWENISLYQASNLLSKSMMAFLISASSAC